MDQETDENINYISGKFEEISKQAEKLTFSRINLSFFTIPDKKLKSHEIFLFNMSHPLTTPFQTQSAFFLILYISSILFINSFVFGFMTINSLFVYGSSISILLNSYKWVNLLLNIVFGGYCCVISYKWWIDSIFIKNNWRSKLIFLFLFGLLMFSFSTQINPLGYSTNSVNIIIIILLFIITIIPSLTFFIALLFDALQSILNFLYSLFGGYIEINNPRPLKKIEEIVIGEIPHLSTNQNEEQNKSWKLLNLPLKDIQTIHEWSKESREGSEKRLIPTTILLTIIGIFFSIQFFIDGVTNIFNDFTFFFQPKSFVNINPSISGPVIVNFLLIFIIASFLFSLFKLIKNIVAQNLVIEACLLAEYKLDIKSKNEKTNKKQNWFEKFFNCFGFYRKEN